MPASTPTALSSLRVSRHMIPRHAMTPNCSIQNKPVLIYHSCLPSAASASQIESHLDTVGVVAPQWRFTMYPTSHFHSTTHEVLCVSSGRARLRFGGDENPARVDAEVGRGDVIVVPAGVAHRLLDHLHGRFEMVGSYPVGAGQWDMCYGQEGEAGKVEGIAGLGWFGKDPIYGEQGPVLDV